MELYFSPLSCSLATRIALYEAGLDGETTFHQVSLATKQLAAGGDYRAINAKGQVPALVTREGSLLTENAAVLQYVADLAPGAGLAPPAGAPARYALQEWLSYIATELHKQVFALIFNPGPPTEAITYARTTALPPRLAFVDRALAGREVLVGDQFTVADAYLLTVLNWCRAAEVDLAPYGDLRAYRTRMNARPHAARAIAEEMKLAGRA